MSNARMRRFTREEVEDRNLQGTITLIINNVVYDVTSFVNQHPGGASRLFQFIDGEDASQSFFDAGHSSYAVAMREQFRIGEVVESEHLPVIGDEDSEHLPDEEEEEEPQMPRPHGPRVVVEADVLAAARRLIWLRRRRANDRRPVRENDEMLDEACKVLMASFMFVTTLLAVASEIYGNLSRNLYVS